MNTGLTAQDLVQFEKEIADLFNTKQIKAVIHLYSGGEEHMLKVFEDINPEDWVMCSWRSHYQCLLKGVPGEELKAEIIAGRSIALCFPTYRIVSSGIVGGIVPIALGVAFAIKRGGGVNRVHCFLGDMTSETGIFHECTKYARNFDLPITFHIEDNSLSVCTDTRAAWGNEVLTFESGGFNANVAQYLRREWKNIEFSKYTTGKYPHAGSGERIQF
jgi:TPP-dependent pyruvate/acetoin dehydrogenase alpha subunit